MLGLKHTLTATRSYGLLCSLKRIQKKETGNSSSVGIARRLISCDQSSVNQASEKVMEADNSGACEQQSMKSSIEKKLKEALTPTVLVVDDVSHQHAGHAGVREGSTETHFNVKVISDKFTGSSLIKRHRLVYMLLDEELKNGVHALSLVTKTPSEPT